MLVCIFVFVYISLCSIVWVNSRGEFIYSQPVVGFVRENNKVMQRCRILRRNSIWKKPRGGWKEFTIFKIVNSAELELCVVIL